MRALIAGSRLLELNGDVAQVVLEELTSLSTRKFDEILLRRPLRGPVRAFEALVGSIAEVMAFRVTYHAPEPGGRAMVFLRDVTMVAAADEVICYFAADAEMLGGTAHVAEKALDQHKPVRAYAIVDGVPIHIGSDNEVQP